MGEFWQELPGCWVPACAGAGPLSGFIAIYRHNSIPRRRTQNTKTQNPPKASQAEASPSPSPKHKSKQILMQQ